MPLCIRAKSATVHFFDSCPATDNSKTVNGHLIAAIRFSFDTTTVEGFSSTPYTSSNHADRQTLERDLRKIFDVAQTCWGIHVFGLWWQLHEILRDKATLWNIDALTSQTALSLFEAALIDAYCRARQTPFHKLLTNNNLGIDLALMRPELKGKQPSDFLPNPTLAVSPRIPINITENGRDLAAKLSHSADHFKIILSGKTREDYDALRSLASGIQEAKGNRFKFSIDGAAAYRSAQDLKLFWDLSTEDPVLKSVFGNLLHVEEPFVREMTFDKQVLSIFSEWPKRPPIVLSTSDNSFNSLPKAIEHGYAGTTHSKSKGIFKGIANRCLLIARKNREPVGKYTMSGEGVAITDPIGWGQDLVVQASLGFTHVSIQSIQQIPLSIQQMWRRSETRNMFANNLETSVYNLKLEAGQFSIESLLELPFGHDIESLPFDDSTLLYS